MRDDFVGNGGELGLAGVESEAKGAVGTNDVRRPMEQGSDKAQDIAAHYELIWLFIIEGVGVVCGVRRVVAG